MTNPSSALPMQAEAPPFRVDAEGVIRIGASRITLDLIVEQYENGMSPEDLVRAYNTLQLADVYCAIAYYLNHKGEVLAYLQKREGEAKLVQMKAEYGKPILSRDELTARRIASEKANAATGK
jgi:uncharacterized protein (DUF433 family)